jgi:predicted helicase
VYGLLLARLDKGEQLNEQKLNYLENIPVDYRLLYEFLDQAYENRSLPTEIKIALTNIGKNINLIDTDAITNEFQKINNGKQNIAVYLYEDFLAQYDKYRGTENRKEGGVYYTPSEATDFITHGVNHLLKTHFDLPKGYNSDNVKVLDFACGTGTFIHSVFEQMIPNNPDNLEKIRIKNKIINDIYGFELLFTPYIVSHTILMRFLKEKGINLGNDRLGIYLTNTLDISSHSISELLPSLKKEYEKAQSIKDRESILAIVGNPPYFNGKSRAKKGVIDAELQKYKQGLNEKKINLDDLYIKFIRFAEWKIQRNGFGVIGIITNNSFLDGVTHRQMRKHLYETFDEIYIVNLHGNTRKGESDKNIFDIMVGVSITFFVKHKTPQPKTVRYFSTFENNLISRAEKLSFLEDSVFSKIKWKKLKPEKTEYYWFADKDLSLEKEYKKFWKVTDIFSVYNSGIKTDRDELVVNYNKKMLEKNMQIAFSGDYSEEFKKKYRITNSSSYNFAYKLKSQKFNKGNTKHIQYRLFDNRYIYYLIGFTSRPSENTTKHFENENLGLIFTRNVDKNYTDVFISDKPIDIHVVNGQNYLAPLYIYNGGSGYAELDFDGHKRYANFTQDFIKKYIKKLDFQPIPEEILAYIYAVLHSSVYRSKYIEFLKTDFPAAPFTTNKDIFYKYAKLGQKLIDLHLLKKLPTYPTIRVNFDFDKDFVIETINQDINELQLFTTDNKTVTFEGITSQIYNFEIGSYKPIDKWLKYRIKDKVLLNSSDLQHLKNMIVALKNTILTMQDIEKLGEGYLK